MGASELCYVIECLEGVHSKGLCIKHYRRAYKLSKPVEFLHKPAICPDCGGPRNIKSARCRACFYALNPKHAPCIGCGTRLRRKGSIRCRPCFFAWKRAVTKKACSIDGCQLPHRAKGLCQKHYKLARYRRPRGARRADVGTKAWVSDQPCQLCGYNKLRSHVHRLNSKLPYAVGNMTAVCARCHEEIHRGIAAQPEPIRG